jgi:16S rRNA (adenine1518-N6/adenine1519-N6)-dimethyltransferase
VDESPRRVLAQLGVRPRKGLGQNFLVDSRVAGRQVGYASIRPTDTVLEIGPGLGVLTRQLLDRAKRVIAIEADRRFATHLRRSLPEVDVISGDALKVDWPPFDVMASNLPYQISSPITFRLLDHSFDRAVLMYQWEFARRMRAKPGTADYSRLTVGVYRRAECEILERVPRNAFHPQPRVDSAIVSLHPRPAPFPLSDPDRFDAVVDALFAHRRKTVENGLRLGWRSLASSEQALEASLPNVPHRTRRVGDLSPEEIARIADALPGPKA